MIQLSKFNVFNLMLIGMLMTNVCNYNAMFEYKYNYILVD